MTLRIIQLHQPQPLQHNHQSMDQFPLLSHRHHKTATLEPDFTDDDFALQLQQGMEQLMREMEASPAARSEFESLVKSMTDATAGPSTTTTKTSFSETLSRTMERIQESESAADKARGEDCLTI